MGLGKGESRLDGVNKQQCSDVCFSQNCTFINCIPLILTLLKGFVAIFCRSSIR